LAHPWVVGEPAPNGAHEQHHGTKALVGLVYPLLNRANEGRPVEYWEHRAGVVEITVREVPQKVHVRELEKHRFGFEHGDQPLERE